VGDVTQTINVSEEAPLVETANASTGQVVDKQKLDDLPNMGRNPFYETVKISQEVTPAGDPKFNRMEDQSGSSQISINGGPITGNNYTLDGIAITNSANQAVIVPPPALHQSGGIHPGACLHIWQQAISGSRRHPLTCADSDTVRSDAAPQKIRDQRSRYQVLLHRSYRLPPVNARCRWRESVVGGCRFRRCRRRRRPG